MLNLKLFRLKPEELSSLFGAKRYSRQHLEKAIKLDEQRRKLLATVEEARAEKNTCSKLIGQKNGDEREELILKMQQQNKTMAEAESELQQVKTEFQETLASIPNPPFIDVPEDDEVLRMVGTKPTFTFTCKDHVELGEELGWLNIEAASNLSGARFNYLHGGAVLLQNALVSWVGGLLHEKGFLLTIPPVLVRKKGMFDTGFFPAEEFEIYHLEKEELYLVGTSEVPLAALHCDDTIGEEELPKRYAAYSTCFRREAGASGKDTKGIFRVHQFDKMEMFSFCHPQKSEEEHQYILAIEEEIVKGLGLHYRVVHIGGTSLGAPAARKYDIEAWFPHQERYREITSCSNCTDFQARRLGARTKLGKKVSPLHTLNGTAVAIGRTLIAIMENYQQENGKILVPQVLRPFLPGQAEVLG